MKTMLCALLFGAVALPASAQFRKAEDAIKYRKAAFTVMGNHFGRIGAMVNNRAPYDAKAASENAAIVAALATLPFDAFDAGTEKGFDTRAKAALWAENDKFRAAAKKMQEETAKLASVAKAGNPDTLKAAFGDAAKSCKNCHDSYREE
ncbi:c-type cytochrome [Piscinibacter sakaiensis]|uniref:c-type cytochrome n=1 Tax=Piscinibacter sakaiensis TaxID=1547922 RepID=UPI003AADD0F2